MVEYQFNALVSARVALDVACLQDTNGTNREEKWRRGCRLVSKAERVHPILENLLVRLACPICGEDFVEGALCVLLYCTKDDTVPDLPPAHPFCVPCIDKWIMHESAGHNRIPRCPLCMLEMRFADANFVFKLTNPMFNLTDLIWNPCMQCDGLQHKPPAQEDFDDEDDVIVQINQMQAQPPPAAPAAPMPVPAQAQILQNYILAIEHQLIMNALQQGHLDLGDPLIAMLPANHFLRLAVQQILINNNHVELEVSDVSSDEEDSDADDEANDSTG